MGAGNPCRKGVSGERLTIYIGKGGLAPFFPGLLPFPKGKEEEKGAREDSERRCFCDFFAHSDLFFVSMRGICGKNRKMRQGFFG